MLSDLLYCIARRSRLRALTTFHIKVRSFWNKKDSLLTKANQGQGSEEAHFEGESLECTGGPAAVRASLPASAVEDARMLSIMKTYSLPTRLGFAYLRAYSDDVAHYADRGCKDYDC